MVEVQFRNSVEEEILEPLKAARICKARTIKRVCASRRIPCKAEAELVDEVWSEVIVSGHNENAILTDFCAIGNQERLWISRVDVLSCESPKDQRLLTEILVAANIELVRVIA